MFIRLENAVKKYGSGETLVYALDHAGLTLGERNMRDLRSIRFREKHALEYAGGVGYAG